MVINENRYMLVVNTVTCYKADVSSVSPSSERMFRSDEANNASLVRSDEGLTLETSAL